MLARFLVDAGSLRPATLMTSGALLIAFLLFQRRFVPSFMRAGIRTEMEKQFEEWGMTAAEREIGLLILKGLSHKEVASLRGTSEATVRQQAKSIYYKSSLPGKTAFSADFLDDVFAPEPIADDSTTH